MLRQLRPEAEVCALAVRIRGRRMLGEGQDALVRTTSSYYGRLSVRKGPDAISELTLGGT